MDSLAGLRLLSNAGYIVSMCPHLLNYTDYKDEVDHLISNPQLIDKIKEKQPVLQKEVVAVEKPLKISQEVVAVEKPLKISQEVVAVEKPLKISQPSELSKKCSERTHRNTDVATSCAANEELPSAVYRILQEIGSVELKLIMEKSLTASDLNRGLGRLSFRSGNLLSDFLKPEEREHLENRREVPIVVIEPSLEVSSLALKSWKMSKGLVHVMTGGWNRVAHNPNNKLQEHDIVQVWFFRTGTRLGMALVKMDVGEEETGGGGSQPPPSTTNF